MGQGVLYRFVLILVGCALVLVGCGQTSKVQESFDILQAGQPIPLVTTQALSVHSRLQLGLAVQSLEGMAVQTLEANDLKGQPFLDLTFTSPKEMGDVWRFGLGLTGQEWAGDDEDSPWSTTIVGATTVRDVIVTSNIGLDLLRDMAKTVAAMGGVDRLQEIVAVEAQIFVLRDSQGQLWDIREARPLTEEEEQQAHELYKDIYKVNNTPEVAEMAQEIWEETLANSEMDPQSLSLQDFAGEDGSLDLKRVKQAIERGLSTLTEDPDSHTCVLFVCVPVKSGFIKRGRQATQGGGVQEYWKYSQPDPFRMPWCVANFGVNDDALLGCGPSAFIGLVLRKYIDGHSIFDKSYNGGKGTSYQHIAKMMTAPGKTGFKRPVIAEYMGTCWLVSGGLTTAKGFTLGARDFLRENAPSLKIRDNYSHAANNTLQAPEKAKILVKQIGERNNTVVAEYFIGFAQGHYAGVEKYRITYGITTGVDVKTMDHPNSWYSLSAIWGTERGVFYLEY